MAGRTMVRGAFGFAAVNISRSSALAGTSIRVSRSSSLEKCDVVVQKDITR